MPSYTYPLAPKASLFLLSTLIQRISGINRVFNRLFIGQILIYPLEIYETIVVIKLANPFFIFRRFINLAHDTHVADAFGMHKVPQAMLLPFGKVIPHQNLVDPEDVLKSLMS